MVLSCRDETKVVQQQQLETPKQHIENKLANDPTYGETVDWILEKINLYAEGYDREYYKNSEFEEFYPKVRMTYESIKIQYGKIFITETYRYSGANLSKENKYEGFIIRQNTQEIPINDIEEVKLFKGDLDFCNLTIKTKTPSVKFVRNLQMMSKGYDPDIPKPIIEYEEKGGVYFRCNTESDLEQRLVRAFEHLKKINLERYPEKKEDF